MLKGTRLRPPLNGLLLGRMVVMLLTLQFGVAIAYAGPVIRTVSSKGQDSGDCVKHACRTIQFAINTAADGDTIRVLRGLYNEQLTIDSRNSLLIDGVGASKTIIEGNHSDSQVRVGDSINIEIRNLAIRNGGILGSNEGGGVQVLGSSVKLDNLILADNEAVNGGAVAVENGVINIINCLIVANEAVNGGGGVSVDIDSSANIESSTIADNSGTFVAGGVSSQGKLVVSNSIVWGNSFAQIGDLAPGVAQVHFSDVQDGHLGVGNLDQDPLFRNPQAGNYRLDASSPAIDAGTNAGAPATDLDGRLRPLDGNRDGLRIGDMGAFEFGRGHRDD